MKKLILVPLLAFGMLHAAGKDGVSRIKTMQNMEEGLSSIQRGLMYNDGSLIVDGAERIQKYAGNINAFKIKEDKESGINAKEYAAKASKSISDMAADIKKAYKDEDKQQVLDSYRKIQNACISCHKVIRKW